MATKTQGTHIFFVDGITKPDVPVLVKMDCPTGISGVGGGAKNQIKVTCLDEVNDEQFVGGLGTPSAVSVQYNFDPTKTSHQLLNALKENGGVVTWMVCLSDGVAEPVLSGTDITAATDRTCIKFRAYISENTVEIATNEIVKGTLSLQRSGKETFKYKGKP